MEAIDLLRGEIKSYFPESSELQLSGYFAKHLRFNFYFSLKASHPYLLYLNVDGDSNRFVLKCLEFHSTDILHNLIESYPEFGSKVFNIGQPKSTASFIYLSENRISVQNVKGSVAEYVQIHQITIQDLVARIAPEVA